MVLKDKTLKCWGDNTSGALGINSLAAVVTTPTTVLNETGDGPLTDVESVVMGKASTCALLTTGQVRCWGANAKKQLGSGSAAASEPLPVVVLDPSGVAPLGSVVSLAAGYRHYCALLGSGEARCWGDNYDGQLGDNSTTTPSFPVVVLNETGAAPLGGIQALAAGSRQSCTLLQSGEVRCWGGNYWGQLGNGEDQDSLLPSPVLDIAGAGAHLSSAVSLGVSGDQACVLLASGEARCWGGIYGSFPLPIVDAATATVLTGGDALAVGESHACGIFSDKVRCWGANHLGQLGDGTEASRYGASVALESSTSLPLASVSEIAANSDFSCGLVNGYVHCWGDNQFGQQGTPAGAGILRASPMLLDAAIRASAKGSNTCAVLENGKLLCWGSTAYGQIGSGALPSSEVPLPMPLLRADGQEFGSLVQVAAGGEFSCGLTTTGEVWCWGYRSGGRLGDGMAGTLAQSDMPVRVRAMGGVGYLSSVTRLVATNERACALLSSGEVVCWGNNDYGQLGDGTTTPHHLPVKVKDGSGTGVLSSVIDLAASAWHTCAALSNGEAWCWGYNGSGALGDGTFTDRLLPVRVKDGPGTGFLAAVQTITAGAEHTCALLSSGQAWCWGINAGGRLGDGTTTNRSRPVRVKDAAGTGYLAPAVLSAGSSHTCAAAATGQAWCWGTNAKSALGDGTTTNRSLPVPVKDEAGTGTLASVAGIIAGNSYTCAFSSSGDAWCWGNNYSGTLGDGTVTTRALPVRVRDTAGSGYLGSVIGLALGDSHSCATLSSGHAQCWGYNGLLALGNNSSPTTAPPSVVRDPSGLEDLTSITSVGIGYNFACAVAASGNVWCWGRNDKSQLGDGTQQSRALPVQVRDSTGAGYLTSVSAIAVGDANVCALTTTGEAWCWGSNTYGQLGDGTTTTRALPVRVKDAAGTGYLSTLSVISAGSTHVCTADSAGSMWCWGANFGRQLGDGTNTSRSLPVRVKDAAGTGFLSSVARVASGGRSTCAITSTGDLWCWGGNLNGELGDGTTTDRALPVRVKDESGTGNLGAVDSVVMGGSIGCAVSSGGQAWCWGENSFGQLGDGTKTQRTLPVRVKDDDGIGLLEPIKSLAGSGTHTCAVMNTGELRCWGYNSSQQLGSSVAIKNYRTLAAPLIAEP